MKVRLVRFLVVAFAALVVVAPANAAASQSANVPYLAWVGQQLRVVVCENVPRDAQDPEVQGLLDLLPSLGPAARAVLEDWSGESAGGFIFVTPQDLSLFLSESSGFCVSTMTLSLKPGLAVIKVAFATDLTGYGFLFPNKASALAVWMKSSMPVLVNLGPSTFVSGAGADLKATVKGTFPLGNTLAGLVPGDVATLPDQWAQLANLLAVDPSAPNSTGAPGGDPQSWDAHDDTLATSGYVSGSCGSGSAIVDAVDNCLGGTPAGPFSFVLGGAGVISSGSVYGPFDRSRLGDTLLADGKLDAGDAPMPPLRMDFALGASSTAGSLTDLSKANAYSRDATGVASAGNLFAPFYAAYIPATRAPLPEASGTAGGFGNNFPGPIVNGLYTFWDTVTLSENSGTSQCRDSLGSEYSLAGATLTSGYTDEHGEARVHLASDTVTLVPDGQNRCDLGLADGVAQTVGSASVTAAAVYPDQGIGYEPNLGKKTSNPVALVVQESAGASLSCVPHGVGESLCFIGVRDLSGAPVPGAEIRFVRNPLGTIEPASSAAGGFDPTGQGVVSAAADVVVLTTNAQGTAGVRVVTSPPNPVLVTAQLLGTRWTPGSPGVARQATIDTSVFDQTAKTAPPGGTVSTDSPPSPTDPVQTSVTTPTGGAVTVVESSQTPTGPPGYTFLDKQVTITAPVETPGNPLTLIFQIDASALGSADPSTLEIFRNGVLVPGCTGAPGVASPAPRCVWSRTSLPGGGAQFIVLTEAASVWTFARRAACVGPPPPGAIVRGSGNHTINGTSSDDVIVDMAGNNTINGNGGNDTICTGPGNDRVDGGAGNDTIIDTGGNNQVDGGPGTDTVTTGGGNDKLDGGVGDDTISAGDGTNQVDGGAGNDGLAAGAGNDKFDGGLGTDTINAGAGANQVDGGAGDDAIATGAGADQVNGGIGDDTIVDAGGNNDVSGGEGADVITMGSGDDKVDGGIGNDTINAGDGNNQVDGRAGTDSITTGSGNDKIDGGPGFDTCHPGAGKNTVINCEA